MISLRWVFRIGGILMTALGAIVAEAALIFGGLAVASLPDAHAPRVRGRTTASDPLKDALAWWMAVPHDQVVLCWPELEDRVGAALRGVGYVSPDEVARAEAKRRYKEAVALALQKKGETRAALRDWNMPDGRFSTYDDWYAAVAVPYVATQCTKQATAGWVTREVTAGRMSREDARTILASVGLVLASPPRRNPTYVGRR